MKWAVLLGFAALWPLSAEEIFLTCQVTQIAAKEGEGSSDSKLKKIQKFLDKSEAAKKYKGFKFVNKKSLSATKQKSGSIKLKNGKTFRLKPMLVHRAQRKNNLTLEVDTGDGSEKKTFIDRDYLILNAGELDKKSDLVLAVSCPVFP